MEVNGIKIHDTLPGQATGQQLIAENFDKFLTLLTTQLQNQDPLSPLDTTEFTNQLTNFAQVEQIINSNKKLDTLIGMQTSSQLTTGVSYIGKLVEADGNHVLLQDGKARIGYSLDQGSARTNITILNANGTPVRFLSGSTSAGPHLFDWDGTDESGRQLTDGVYKALVTAFDNEDRMISTSTTTFGKVTGVEVDNGIATLIMGPLSVDMEDIHSVHEAPKDNPETT